MHTFLLGYNLESSDWSRPGVTQAFLRAAVQLHKEMNAPCTFFVRGQAIEDHPDDFRRARDEAGDLADFQQYTYSCLPLKSVCQEGHQGKTLFQGGTLQQIRDDVARASDVMERVLGARPIGLCGPLGSYRGLSDRPDILEVLHRLGIRFTRTYTRNARDASPVSFEVQPFAYAEQGFADVLEIPGQGWPDYLLREVVTSADRYVQYACKDLDYISAKGLVWSAVQHDWSAIQGEPLMRATRSILEYVRQLNFKMQTHAQYYRDTLVLCYT